jgi:hypothetical protein
MIESGDTLIALYTEDESEFFAYNAVMFPPVFKTNFQTNIDAAHNVTKDEIVVDEQQEETLEVTAKMKECFAYFQKMKPTIMFTFPNKQAVWNQFGFDDYEFARRSQGRMMQFMNMLNKTSVNYSVELIAKGWTQVKIDQCGTLAAELKTENTEQEQAKKDRPVETQERIVILNTCWEDMVFVTNAAKAVFYDNYAKLHQYILPEGGGDEQHTFNVDVATGATENVTEQTFATEDEITIENMGTGDLDFGMMNLVDDVVAPGAGVTIAAGTSQTVTASELGDVTQNHFLNVTNNGSVDGSCKVIVL